VCLTSVCVALLSADLKRLLSWFTTLVAMIFPVVLGSIYDGSGYSCVIRTRFHVVTIQCRREKRIALSICSRNWRYSDHGNLSGLHVYKVIAREALNVTSVGL